MNIADAFLSALRGQPAQQATPAGNLIDISQLPNSQGGSFATGLLNAAQSGFTLPGDVATGRVDPRSDEGIARTQDLAGLAMTGGLAGAGEGATVGSGPIRAYHGSPHDFDRFDLSKIGTGEGAQAYGHGLYFAENEATAKSYRDALAQTVKVDGKPILSNNKILGSTGSRDLDDLLIAHNGDLEAAIADVKAHMGTLTHAQITRGGVDRELAGLEGLRGKVETANNGRMYEVAIHADPERFLDWDKPLEAQSEAVRLAAAKSLRMPLPRSGAPTFAGGIEPSPTGSMLHDMLGDQMYAGKAQVAQRLNEAGIPGIKYLDQGSRAAGDGSRNYVTFSDKIVEIMRKYGVASFAALPPAVQMMLQDGQAASDPKS